MLPLVRLGAACAFALAAAAQEAGPLTPVRYLDGMDGRPVDVAVAPSGRTAAWADDRGRLHWIVLPVAGTPRRAALPPGPLERVAFVDDDHVDVWTGSAAGVPPARFRLSLAAGGAIVGAAADEPPPRADPDAFRERLHERLWGGGRELHRVAVSRDGRVVLAAWSTGHVTWHVGAERGDLVDASCHGLALSRDGRFVAARLSTRVVVADLDDAEGAIAALPIAASSVAGLTAGPDGSEVLVVTGADVQRWDPVRRRRLQSTALPVEGRRVVVHGACASRDVVAVRAWIDGTEPWLGLLDLPRGTWRQFAFAHGSMAWSLDGATLLVGSGGPTHVCDDPDVVRLVPRVRGSVRAVDTPGYHLVTALPRGRFLGVDSRGRVFRSDFRRPRHGEFELWGAAAALSSDWLLVTDRGVALRPLDGGADVPVLRCGSRQLALAREARRAAVADGARIHVLSWPAQLPRPARNGGGGARRTW